MAKIEFMVNGKAYPCRQTMGAMLRFKQETGKEIDAIGNNVSLICTFLYCCVVSACKHDGIEFDLSLMDFADSISPTDLKSWMGAAGAVGDSSVEGEKKS